VVSDDKGGIGRTTVPVTVGNSVPVVKFVSPRDGDFFIPGEPISYRLEVSDPEDGSPAGRELEFSMRTLVSSAWASGDGKLSDVDPGLSRMKQSDCFNCHAIDQKIVGPPLIEVAKKYKGMSGAIEASVDRVIKGSANVWGPIPMLPHSQHTADEVHMMVKWIYGLADGQATPTVSRGLRGPDHRAERQQARLRPGGGDVYRPRSRSRRSAFGQGPGQAPHPTRGGGTSGRTHRPTQARQGDRLHCARSHRPFQLDPARRSRFGEDTGLVWGSGGKIELHSGTPDGSLLGTIEVPVTGGWDKFAEFQTKVTPPSPDRADVYLVFVNPGKGGLMNVDWVEFSKRDGSQVSFAWTAARTPPKSCRSMEEFRIVPEALHNDLGDPCLPAPRLHGGGRLVSPPGCAPTQPVTAIGTHNALKALHLDHLFGTGIGEWKPGAQIEVRPTRFPAVQHWNANRKIGQAVAYQAFDTCIELAEKYGVGVVAVDNATHYLWGGGYAIDVAKRGYIAYTNCTSSLAEVVAIWWKIPDAGHQPPHLGISHHRGDRLPGGSRLGHFHRCHGPGPTTETRGRHLASGFRRRQRGTRHP